jgi:hypothetical protein
MAPSPIIIKWLLPEVWCNITMTIIMCTDRWNSEMIMIYMYQNRELRENASRNVLNRKNLFSWTFFLRPHDFNFQHKNKKIIYQIIFFKRLIKNRGIWEAWIFRWKTVTTRVLLLAFNIHLRKTIPKSQIG